MRHWVMVYGRTCSIRPISLTLSGLVTKDWRAGSTRRLFTRSASTHTGIPESEMGLGGNPIATPAPRWTKTCPIVTCAAAALQHHGWNGVETDSTGVNVTVLDEYAHQRRTIHLDGANNTTVHMPQARRCEVACGSATDDLISVSTVELPTKSIESSEGYRSSPPRTPSRSQQRLRADEPCTANVPASARFRSTVISVAPAITPEVTLVMNPAGANPATSAAAPKSSSQLPLFLTDRRHVHRCPTAPVSSPCRTVRARRRAREPMRG
jgi:hypothetical protein